MQRSAEVVPFKAHAKVNAECPQLPFESLDHLTTYDIYGSLQESRNFGGQMSFCVIPPELLDPNHRFPLREILRACFGVEDGDPAVVGLGQLPHEPSQAVACRGFMA